MRIHILTAAIVAVLATGYPAHENVLSALAPHIPALDTPAPGSMPTSVRPTPPSVPPGIQHGLELRQALDLLPVAAPPAEIVPAVPAAPLPAPVDLPAAVLPKIAPPDEDPLVAPGPPPVMVMPPIDPFLPLVPLEAVPVGPLPSMTSTMPPPLVTGDDFVTVQWVETHIGTLRTWVPKTYTFHFEPMSQAPLPGVGSIGMGTLTGQIGQTQTIFMVVGAAPTPIFHPNQIVAAAVVVGIAGIVV